MTNQVPFGKGLREVKLTGCTMSCSEGHTYEYGCLLDRCGDPAPATVTFDLPTPDTRAAFLRNTKAAIEAACPDITVVFYGKAPKYVEEQWSPDEAPETSPPSDNVGHHPACDDPEQGGVDPRDCPGCEEAAEGEAAFEALHQTHQGPQGCSCNVNEPDMCAYCNRVADELKAVMVARVEQDPPGGDPPCADPKAPPCRQGEPCWCDDAPDEEDTHEHGSGPCGQPGLCTCGGGVDDHDAATHYRDCPVHDPVACPLCPDEVEEPVHDCETPRCWSECHPTYNVGFTGGKVTPGARRVPVSPDIVGEGDVRRATLADHHPACQDPNDDPADCLECAEAAEDEADFARRHRETLLDYTDFYAVPTAGDYYAARKRAACHRECRGAADCIGMVNGKCMAPTTEKENDADAGTGLFATVRRGARAFRRGFIAAFTATGGPGGGIPG